MIVRDERGSERSEEASIVFSFIVFYGSKVDNDTDGNEYSIGIVEKSETKLLQLKQTTSMIDWKSILIIRNMNHGV
jgi:hypothetical protein